MFGNTRPVIHIAFVSLNTRRETFIKPRMAHFSAVSCLVTISPNQIVEILLTAHVPLTKCLSFLSATLASPFSGKLETDIFKGTTIYMHIGVPNSRASDIFKRGTKIV